MDYKAKITVIIPVYNTEGYLRQCLDSICGQTLKELQIIIVDDGSTDGSIDVLNEYAEKDERIQVLHHEHTGNGAAGARNLGLDHAIGEYVLILDSDDWFDLELAEKAYIKAKNTDADVVIYDANYLDAKDRVMRDKTVIMRHILPDKEVFCFEDCPSTFFQITYTNAWSKLWRRECIDKNGIRFQSIYWLDDAMFMCKAMTVAKRIAVLDERLVNYRYYREGNQSSSKDKDPLACIKFSKEFKAYLKEKQQYNLLKESFWHLAMQTCIYQLNTFNKFQSFRILYNELKNNGIEEILDYADNYTYFSEKTRSNQMVDLRSQIFKSISKIIAIEPEEYVYERFVPNKQRRIMFPSDLVRKDESVVLYGAGAIGKAYFIQNLNSCFCKIIAWVDKSYEQKGFPISAPEEIIKFNYDKIVIAIEDEKIVEEVRNYLLEIGIDKEKIVWQAP